jgi:hypothetical protein
MVQKRSKIIARPKAPTPGGAVHNGGSEPQGTLSKRAQKTNIGGVDTPGTRRVERTGMVTAPRQVQGIPAVQSEIGRTARTASASGQAERQDDAGRDDPCIAELRPMPNKVRTQLTVRSTNISLQAGK